MIRDLSAQWPTYHPPLSSQYPHQFPPSHPLELKWYIPVLVAGESLVRHEKLYYKLSTLKRVWQNITVILYTNETLKLKLIKIKLHNNFFSVFKSMCSFKLVKKFPFL